MICCFISLLLLICYSIIFICYLLLFPSRKLLFAPYNSLRFHCVKSVQIRSFFWSVFSCVRTRRNSVFCYYVTKQTCYKFPENTTCIDLLLTNHPHKFLCIWDRFVGLSQNDSDCNESIFSNALTKNHNYRDYGCFQNSAFREELPFDLLNINFEENEKRFSKFLDICKKVLNHYAPC